MSGYFEDQLNTDESVVELQQLMDSIARWLEINGFMNDQIHERFERMDEMLGNNYRNLLFLAEFSRGKSELINAIIFGMTGKRLLPSTPGRTTRCTTVLQYEEDELPGVRLLPTMGSHEAQRQTISQLKKSPELWERTLFSPDDTENIAAVLKQIAETELVELEVARELGFAGSTDDGDLAKIDVIHGKVAIPKYRHAIINYPHPLLKQGLEIVDTPGLNALGIEPELTLRSLESANAIIFVVSADTGITRSELEAWTEHVKQNYAHNVIVVLNKIDMLWDTIKSREEIDVLVKKQVAEVARILEIPSNRVYPISAQKALVARRDKDHRLEQASRINSFEQALADTINATNRDEIILRARVEVMSTLNVANQVMVHRKQATQEQIKEIRAMMASKFRVTDDNMNLVRRERERLVNVSKEINLFRVDLKMEYDHFVDKLDIFALDKLIARYRLEISNQLTSTGLQREMNQFQNEAVEKFQAAIAHVTVLEKKLQTLYKKVEDILGTQGLEPREVHPEIYLASLRRHSERHFKYTSGKAMVMTEQNALRDRYYVSVMIKIRKLYIQTRDEVDRWCRSALVPLELEIRERGAYLKKRLLSLERIRNQDNNLVDELNVLEARMESHQQRQNTIKHFYNRLEDIARDEKPEVSNVIDLQSRRSAG